jgi:acetyl esterase/lipase
MKARKSWEWLLRLVTIVSVCLILGDEGAARRPPTGPEGRRGQEMPDAIVDRDLVYRTVNGQSLRLDLYRPRTGAGPFPVVMWLYGGAWIHGRKERTPAVALVKDGYAIASIDIRSTNTAPFPAQIEDCKTAVRWLRANAAKYRLDRDHIGVWGFSSGGHLAALLGTTCGIPELEGKGDNPNESSCVQAIYDVAGPSDLVQMYDQVTDEATEMGTKARDAIDKLIGGPLPQNQQKAIAASPTHYISKDSAPFFIMHGEQDRTIPVEQSKALAAALKAAGVPVQFEIATGRGHGVGGGRYLADVKAFFDRYLKPGQSR